MDFRIDFLIEVGVRYGFQNQVLRREKEQFGWFKQGNHC